MAINIVNNAKNEETFFLEFQINLFLISRYSFIFYSCVQFDSLYSQICTLLYLNLEHVSYSQSDIMDYRSY
jgi:hypothetical protein